MDLLRKFKLLIKWLLFPGVNLHSRQRYSKLPKFYASKSNNGTNQVLDAGCGNGMLSYKSYLYGNKVIGISIKDSEVEGCDALFNQYLGIPSEMLCFKKKNLYDLDFPPESFDEIICSEVLEHLKYDTAICRSFRKFLKPGGVLHLCAPNAEHPYNASFKLDDEERGGHVRSGYTMESFRVLLEPIGFEIVDSMRFGGPIRQAFNWRIKEAQARLGILAGLPLFILSLPFLLFESKKKEKEIPFSIYVKAQKKVDKGDH